MRLIVSVRLFVLLAWLAQTAHAASQIVSLETGSGSLSATLELPVEGGPWPLAVIVGDAGVDRDGNGLESEGRDGIKKLALELASGGVASLRLERRTANPDPSIQEHVSDARAWLGLMGRDARFSSLVVVGHGEGSLSGMIAARDTQAAAFVSVCGLGRPAQRGLLERIESARPADAYVESSLIVSELEAGRSVADMEPGLFRYFRISAQAYLISLFALDPAREFARLPKPALIVRGGADASVGTLESGALASARPDARAVVIPAMRHDLTTANGDLAPGLVDAILAFVENTSGIGNTVSDTNR